MLIDDMLTYLSSGGVGLTSTQTTGPATLYGGVMPSDPDDCVCVYETGGLGPARAFAPGPGGSFLEYAGIKVVSRSENYRTARAVAQKAWLLLDGMPKRTINGVQYHDSQHEQSPFYMGPDETANRKLVAFNTIVLKAISTTS